MDPRHHLWRAWFYGSAGGFAIAVGTVGAFITIVGTVFSGIRTGLISGSCGAAIFAFGAFVFQTIQKENEDDVEPPKDPDRRDTGSSS